MLEVGMPEGSEDSNPPRTANAQPEVRETRPPRVALYSQGMIGFGHVRRNASIAHALRRSALQPSVVMIAEAWQAGALILPEGVDCVTLPALRMGADGAYNGRFLPDVPDQELLALRARVIRSAVEVFKPDVLIVDYLPLGVAGELSATLEALRTSGGTHCVLGLRDVLYDPETTQHSWANRANLDAIRDLYDAVWIYGDASVFDPIREYGLGDAVGTKARFTGYLDQRTRLEFAQAESGPLLANVPPGKLALCVVGGGRDGDALAEAFIRADLPPDTSGIVLTGPLMPWDRRQRLRREAHQRSRLKVLDFVPDPAPLIERADRIVSMGGYNTICEALSFEKHALIVPRVDPEPEQLIRARRLRDLGLVEMLHPSELRHEALTEWLGRDLGPPPDTRGRIDLEGLTRIPNFAAELLHPTANGGPVRG